jgi:hypothetical protein
MLVINVQRWEIISDAAEDEVLLCTTDLDQIVKLEQFLHPLRRHRCALSSIPAYQTFFMPSTSIVLP